MNVRQGCRQQYPNQPCDISRTTLRRLRASASDSPVRVPDGVGNFGAAVPPPAKD